MKKIEYKLTIDDLILEYMILKVKKGYEPSYSFTEFMNFLKYFESKKEVADVIYDAKELFDRFFQRRNANIWNTFDFENKRKVINPHMTMGYSENIKDYVISANYKLSDYDISTINTYFMDGGLGRFDGYKGEVFEIRNIINSYLENLPKREINYDAELNEKDLSLGKYAASLIILKVWNNFVLEQTNLKKWPSQCTDINKYLFETDLAGIIGIKSIKNQIIELYTILSSRIAYLYHEDNGLRISSNYGSYLAHANYKLLINGYDVEMEKVFGPYKDSIDLDLSKIDDRTIEKDKEVKRLHIA